MVGAVNRAVSRAMWQTRGGGVAEGGRLGRECTGNVTGEAALKAEERHSGSEEWTAGQQEC